MRTQRTGSARPNARSTTQKTGTTRPRNTAPIALDVRIEQTEAYANDYKPLSIPPDRWDVIRPLVVDLALGRPRIRTIEEVSRRFAALQGFVDWAHHTCGLSLTARAILTPDNFERWQLVVPMTAGTRATFASRIKAIGREHAPENGWTPKPGQVGKRPPHQPYTSEEVQRLKARVRSQQTPFRTRLGETALALGLGVGADGRTLRLVRSRDVVEQDGWVEVTLQRPERVVVARAEWSAELVRLARSLPPDAFLVRSRIDNLDRQVERGRGDKLELRAVRLRSTYAAALVRDGVPVHVICHALGIEGPAPLGPLLVHGPAYEPAVLAAYLRGGQS